MRIIQLIDSLEAGGAERMAVNYANALAEKVDFSGLVATRKEGALLGQLNDKVAYSFLNRKRTFDFSALLRLRYFVKKNKVTIVQAHSTSFFMAFLLKLVCPSTRLIWHDHYGASEFLEKRPSFILKMVIPFFNGIIVVNQQLKTWAKELLKCKNVIYLPNFPSKEKKIIAYTVLEGMSAKRIVSLANWRNQKNHFLLLEVAKRIKESHPEWTFHLVGQDFNDVYSNQVKNKIVEYNLGNTVHYYGSRQDVVNILDQATIGILTSDSEGLPLALLEYGMCKKAVVVTAVGEIPSIVQHGKNGFMVASEEEELFYKALVELIESELLRQDFGTALYLTISEEFSESAVLEKYVNWIHKIKNE
jgi:glycosyltransferase involved in cell wall biosynthesis